MMDRTYLGLNGAAQAVPGMRIRLGFRVGLSGSQLAAQILAMGTLTFSAAAAGDAFYSHVAASGLGFPASRPATGSSDKAFVIDMKVNPALLEPYTIDSVIRRWEESAPGCAVVRASKIDAGEGSEAGAVARAAELKAATDAVKVEDAAHSLTAQLGGFDAGISAFSLKALAIVAVVGAGYLYVVRRGA